MAKRKFDQPQPQVPATDLPVTLPDNHPSVIPPLPLFPADLLPCPQFEYQQGWLPLASFTDAANAMGREGWELVGLLQDKRQQMISGEPAWVGGVICFWKRLRI